MPDKFNFNPEPPSDVVRFLANKGLKPGFDWRDVWGLEHAHAFTVAKAMQLDLLEDIRTSLVDNIKSGQTFKHWAEQIEPLLKKRGWWGYDTQIDPKTGRPVRVRLGTPRRLKTIYEANIRSARSAGAWERIERTRDSHPFLRYELGPSERHREHHAALEGTLLPVDHAFWDTHYTPNGWGCKCWVRQISRNESEALGGETEAPEITYKRWVNKRTGEVMNVPEGVDPGWQFNPGKRRAQILREHLNGKLERLDDPVRSVAVRDMASSNLLKLMFDQKITHRDATVPVAVVSADLAKSLGSQTRVVVISGETMAKQIRHHKEMAFEDYIKVQAMIDEARPSPENKITGNKTGYDAIFEGKPWRLVFKVTKAGELFLSSIGRINKNKNK